MASPVLEAKGIAKHFGGVTALTDVDIALHKSEIVALVGDNGAGKSTLVKILSGVHPPDEGEILINGQPTRIETPQRAMHLGISTVFQDLALVNERDVAHNILHLHGFRSEPADAVEVFRAFQIEPFGFT